MGHLPSPSSISNNIENSRLVESKVLRTPIQLFSCLLLVMDGSDCVFHSELLDCVVRWQDSCQSSFLGRDGISYFEAGSGSTSRVGQTLSGSILEYDA